MSVPITRFRLEFPLRKYLLSSPSHPLPFHGAGGRSIFQIFVTLSVSRQASRVALSASVTLACVYYYLTAFDTTRQPKRTGPFAVRLLDWLDVLLFFLAIQGIFSRSVAVRTISGVFQDTREIDFASAKCPNFY